MDGPSPPETAVTRSRTPAHDSKKGSHRSQPHGSPDATMGRCIVSGAEYPRHDLFPVAMLRPALAGLLRQQIGDLPSDALISKPELDRLRSAHIAELLRQERGDLSNLEREVVDSLARHDVLAENVEEEIDDKRTLGERLSDHLATFGGSWAFLISFGLFIAVWMATNIVEGQARSFDPYPFILLNLVLSCIAAIQAPIIMMSQRRTEAKDRLRSLNDYRVNLKAELEIRHLHEKFDHMLTRQWERLSEMQEVQIELLQELERRSAPSLDRQ
jgi:uncharacterized membrane protein